MALGSPTTHGPAQNSRTGRSRPPSKSMSFPLRPQPLPMAPGPDEIPTAVVIKNIAFSVKREVLLQTIVALDIPMPYALNYHYEGGVFRGLAFANFRTPEETMIVFATLNGFDLAGRKLKVEYKRML
ncbi:hypothetical protein BJ085DRAFT_17798, partial [Dimargaris cristalligena]